ncbi:MAG: hypothetical protein GX890_07655 [Firmicutes bacterium]|jgi:uncharacterized membrane protein SpoIIM required for sporulation|nr:hypothetical protein [Bacillota bacterium]HPU01015.1 stage II sporulation protein M [Bacillota bacterium]
MLALWGRVEAVIATALDNSFLYLALNNLGVLLLLWMVAAAWLYYGTRVPAPRSRICRLALSCYLFFFLKELLRISSDIAQFSRASQIPHRDVLLNLVLPHGLIEYLAFALGAALALAWLGTSLKSRRWRHPGHRALLIPALLILLAAAIESTLTPHLYAIYLANS